MEKQNLQEAFLKDDSRIVLVRNGKDVFWDVFY